MECQYIFVILIQCTFLLLQGSDDDREEKRREEQERRREARDKQRAKGRTKVRDNDIDPMDPAAYSDTPR